LALYLEQNFQRALRRVGAVHVKGPRQEEHAPFGGSQHDKLPRPAGSSHRRGMHHQPVVLLRLQPIGRHGAGGHVPGSTGGDSGLRQSPHLLLPPPPAPAFASVPAWRAVSVPAPRGASTAAAAPSAPANRPRVQKSTSAPAARSSAAVYSCGLWLAP